MACGIPSRDQPPLQRGDLGHGLARPGRGQGLGGGRGILPGLGAAQRVDHPNGLLRIERRPGAPQRHGIPPPGGGEVGAVHVIGHPGGVQGGLGRGMQRARLLQHMGPSQEAARQRRMAGIRNQRAEGGRRHRLGRGRMSPADIRRGIAAMRALLQPAGHGAAQRLARPQVEVRGLFRRRRAERRLPALGAADGATQDARCAGGARAGGRRAGGG